MGARCPPALVALPNCWPRRRSRRPCCPTRSVAGCTGRRWPPPRTWHRRLRRPCSTGSGSTHSRPPRPPDHRHQPDEAAEVALAGAAAFLHGPRRSRWWGWPPGRSGWARELQRRSDGRAGGGLEARRWPVGRPDDRPVGREPLDLGGLLEATVGGIGRGRPWCRGRRKEPARAGGTGQFPTGSPPLVSPSTGPTRHAVHWKPRPVESKGHPGRQVDRGHRRPGERRGVENDQVAGVSGGVIDDGQDPALVLGPPVDRPDEHRFPGEAVRARVEAVDWSRTRSYWMRPGWLGSSGWSPRRTQ